MNSTDRSENRSAPLDGLHVGGLALEASRASEWLPQLGTLAPPQAIARVTALDDSLAGCKDPDLLTELAAALPARVVGLDPQVCLALASVARQLVTYQPRIADDIEQLEPRLYIEWLRVQIAADGVATLERLDDHVLLGVVGGWSLDAVVSPGPLLQRLARADDVRLRRYAVDWLKAAVTQLAITPQRAFDLLEPLLEDDDQRLRQAALALVSQSWLLDLKPGAQRRRDRALQSALHGANVAVAQSAAVAARQLELRAVLVDTVFDDTVSSPSIRAEVLALLGSLAHDEDIDAVLSLAESDLLQFGAAVREFLLAAHRHGVFLRERHLPSLLRLFDAHAGWTGQQLVRVTHIVRAALLEHLATLPADDRRWCRRAGILAASIAAGSARVLGRLLESTSDATIAAALIAAAGKSPEFTDEQQLLRWLDIIPYVVVPVLRVKGGQRAARRLRALVLDPFCLQALRDDALDALWAICDDRAALLHELSAQLGPHESGLLSKARSSARDDSIAAILAEPPWQNAPGYEVEAAAALRVYCESGEIGFMPQVVRLFRELFSGYVRAALAGDFTIKRVMMPELEQLIFRYGRHLIKDGRRVRRWLDSGPETGRDLLLLIAGDWLQERPPNAIIVALLELFGRHKPSGALLRLIEPYWRHSAREVQRAAIEAILQAGEAARGLELSLGRLVSDAREPRILRQALDAVFALEARWAEPLVLSALRHPQMSVKKAAASALAVIGSSKAVPVLVEWISRHDNRSFRVELLAALDKAAGPASVAVLVDALRTESQPRCRELLADALGGRLTSAGVLRLARSPLEAHRALVEGCLEGRVVVEDATPEQLMAALHRARLLPTPAAADPGRRLRVEGFTAEAACELLTGVDRNTRDGQLEAIVALSLPEWIHWIENNACPPELRQAATELVLGGGDGYAPRATRSHAERHRARQRRA
jgi:hypothetical protein